MSYREWTERLGEHFFGPELDGMPVIFFVDDNAIAEVYGGDSRQGVVSLVQAVSGRLDRGRPRQLFKRIEDETRRWKLDGGNGLLPALPLLALAVLAATRMGRGRDRAGHNYYKPFCELLGGDVDGGLVKVSYADAMPYLWECFQWWLDERHRGGLGFSTVVASDLFTYIGYADSQTLFSSSDRDQLTQFFRWIKLEPGEQVDQSELMTYFRIWASRRADLSEGTAHLLESEEQGTQLAQIVKAAADRWRGVVREDGRRGGEILLTLELVPHPRLGMAAERPEGFPAELSCQGPLGQALTLTSSHEGWYDALPLGISSALLESGLRLAADGVQLRLASQDVHVLEKNVELGQWASAPQISPGEPAWLLVRRRALEEVCGHLEAHAHPGWNVIRRDGIAPRGWSLIGPVVLDATSAANASERLGQIVPRVQNRFSLKGGLPLARPSNAYLTGGEPDVWLPPPSADEAAFEIELDGQPIEAPASTTRLRLANRDLQEGAHTVTLNRIGRSFSTLRTLGRVAPSVESPIGHELRCEGGGSSASTAGARSLPRESASGVVRVVGARVEDPSEVLGPPGPRPVILRVGAARYTLIGPCPGQIATATPPREPGWIVRAGLELRAFELLLGFDVVWAISDWSLDPKVRVRLKRPLEPRPPERGSSQAQIDAWTAAICKAPCPESADAAGLWKAYRQSCAEQGGR